MHSANLDLLRASAHHLPDGQPRDAHAHHRADHLAVLRAARRARWQIRIAKWRTLLATKASASGHPRLDHKT